MGSPWARGSPVPELQHPTLHPTNLVCSWDPKTSQLPMGSQPGSHALTQPTPRAASCCCCIPGGPERSPSPSASRATSWPPPKPGRGATTALRTSTKTKPLHALRCGSGWDLLASARSLGTPFMGSTSHVPEIESPSPETPSRSLCVPSACEQSLGRAGPGEAMLWFEGLIPTFGTGQGGEKSPCGRLPTARPQMPCPAPTGLPGSSSRAGGGCQPPGRGGGGRGGREQRHPSPRRRDSPPSPLICLLPDVARRVLSLRLALEVPSSQAAANPWPSWQCRELARLQLTSELIKTFLTAPLQCTTTPAAVQYSRAGTAPVTRSQCSSPLSQPHHHHHAAPGPSAPHHRGRWVWFSFSRKT